MVYPSPATRLIPGIIKVLKDLILRDPKYFNSESCLKHRRTTSLLISAIMNKDHDEFRPKKLSSTVQNLAENDCLQLF